MIKKAVRLRTDEQPNKAAEMLDAYTKECLDKVLQKLNELREQFK